MPDVQAHRQPLHHCRPGSRPAVCLYDHPSSGATLVLGSLRLLNCRSHEFCTCERLAQAATVGASDAAMLPMELAGMGGGAGGLPHMLPYCTLTQLCIFVS